MNHEHHNHEHHNPHHPNKKDDRKKLQSEEEHLAEKVEHAHEKATGGHDHHHMDQGHGHHDHHNHHAMMIEDFKRRFWVSLVLSIPVLVLSPMIQEFFNYSITFPGSLYVIFGLSTLIFFYGGWPFLKGLKDELIKGSPGMMTLIALAITVAYVYSSAVVLGVQGKMFFWELVTLIDIMLIGHWIEMKSVMGASKALELLVKMMPNVAHRIVEGGTEDVKLEQLKKNDLILVKPGEKIPADGIIEEGESYLDESMLTGESKPVKKVVSEKVIGGAVNGNASLKVKVENIGKDSYLNKVINMVQDAQKTKSKTQHLADRAAKWLTYVALSTGIITLIVWLALGYEFVYALERMVTVMVISCPHALGLAIPLVVAISTAISAKNGLLIRNRTAFENSRKISVMVFDKTGTLTIGNFGVRKVKSVNGNYTENDVLKYAAGLEQHSEHPIAVGILAKAKEENVRLPESKNFKNLTGKGAEAEVDGKKVQIVSPGMLKELGKQIPEGKEGTGAETVVYLVVEGELAGVIFLADEVRPESAEAVKAFKENGVKVYMATGDNKKVAEAVSKQLNLDGFFGEVLPHDKVQIVKEFQSKGEFVAMTGDGVNDAPALAQANVGIAVGSGTDVAAETADIVLVNSNPKDILNLILFGKATYRKMIQNLVWATAYNAFAIPLAAGVLYSIGVVLGPAVGAVFMSLSTVVVAINAQLLKKSIKS